MLFQLHQVVYLIRKRSDNYLVLINWLTNCVVCLDHLFLCWFCQRLQRLVQANRGKKHIINYIIKYLINVGTRLDILKLFTLISETFPWYSKSEKWWKTISLMGIIFLSLCKNKKNSEVVVVDIIFLLKLLAEASDDT